MHSFLARALLVTWFCFSSAGALALDEFDRHTSKHLKEAAAKNAAVGTLSSGQASKLKSLSARVEHACVVVRTSDGNWAKTLLSWGFRKGKDSKGKEGLVPIVVLERYVTYDRDRGDVTLAHGRNIMLFPGYEFDFDIGQIVPADSGADVKFTPERLLAAIDKAKLHPLDGSVLPATPPDKYDPQDHADVRPRDFAGTWRVNADGRWVGTWEIVVDAGGDVSGRYTSEETKASFPIRGRVTETDVRHRLRFEVEFAAASQLYDLYLWTTDKSTMAGTTTLINRTFGVVAERQPLAEAAPKAKADPAKQSARERLKKRVPLAERLKQPVAFHTEGKQPIAEVLEQFSRDTQTEVLVRWDDLPAAEGDPLRRVELDAEKMPRGEVVRTLLKSAYGEAAIYVLADVAGEECLIVTTREAAAKRGDKLPAEFAPPK